jgi:hypothetical protein
MLLNFSRWNRCRLIAPSNAKSCVIANPVISIKHAPSVYPVAWGRACAPAIGITPSPLPSQLSPDDVTPTGMFYWYH